MNAIIFELGGGTTISLPIDVVAQRLIEQLQKPIAQTASPAPTSRPKIGEYLQGQGGIYVGDILGDDGVLYGLIASKEQGVGTAKWGYEGKLYLSNWDGLTNTKSLRNHPAAKLASDYRADNHTDFYLPSQREMMVALANIPKLFNTDGWYWTSTPRNEYYAWAVGFEDGIVHRHLRDREFRVRPFRRFAL